MLTKLIALSLVVFALTAGSVSAQVNPEGPYTVREARTAERVWYYNPAGAPEGVTEAEIIEGVGWWDAAGVSWTYGGHTDAEVLGVGEWRDGVTTIGWGVPESPAQADFRPDECDISLPAKTYGPKGRPLENYVAHEMGHCLGLGHSNDDKALMAYLSSKYLTELGQSDIDGIAALYGPALVTGWNTVSGVSGDPANLRCNVAYVWDAGWQLWARDVPAYVITLKTLEPEEPYWVLCD